MTLPYDYARCFEPRKCPLAARCARTQPGRPEWQSYSAFPGGTECSGFIDNPAPQQGAQP